MIVVNLEMAPK